MINHPNRNRISAARNRWLQAAAHWDEEARRLFGPSYTAAQASSTCELRRRSHHVERLKREYYKVLEARAAPRT